MRKNFLAIIIFFILISCNQKDNRQIDYADKLKGCLNQNDISLLNEACFLFEKKLSEKYQDETIGKKYQSYLKDISSFNLSPDFFQEDLTTDYLLKLKNSKTFDKIWINNKETVVEDEIVTIEIETFDNNDTNEQFENNEDYYLINQNGEYLNCLMTTNENEKIKEYLESIKNISDISPHIYARAFSNTMDIKEFDESLMRLIISMNFYYELKLFTINE